ncbi:MAG: hypothetical protein ACWGPN_15125 [Gammaproteobacteria bacterium]
MADTTFNIRDASVERGVTACFDRYRSERGRLSLGFSIYDQDALNQQADFEVDRVPVPAPSPSARRARTRRSVSRRCAASLRTVSAATVAITVSGSS